jgi:methylated-DNA-[protein]-cysteine S-methyltransferase
MTTRDMMTSTISYEEVDSPIGWLTLASFEGALCQIEFGRFEDNRHKLEPWSERWFGTRSWERDPSALSEVVAELSAYFEGSLTDFSVRLDLRGTPFQVQVWEALRSVPYAQACAYKDIAARIGSPKAVRAVGGANNRNPVPIIVPCHRVIGAAGAMVGYGGGLEIKTFLLRHEGYTSGGIGQ